VDDILVNGVVVGVVCGERAIIRWYWRYNTKGRRRRKGEKREEEEKTKEKKERNVFIVLYGSPLASSR
jgi:hypothetical protein